MEPKVSSRPATIASSPLETPLSTGAAPVAREAGALAGPDRSADGAFFVAGRTDGSVEVVTPCGSVRLRAGQRVLLGWQKLGGAGDEAPLPSQRRSTEVCFAATAGSRIALVRVEVSDVGVHIEAGEIAAADLLPAGRLTVWVGADPVRAEPRRAATVGGSVETAHLLVPDPAHPVVVDAAWMEAAGPAPTPPVRPLRTAPWIPLSDGATDGRPSDAAVFEVGFLPRSRPRVRTLWAARLQAA
ncbi:MAG: hypothetical protein D6705_01760 [Deltaproteobacteria bacterium]|nr:MAG: hypothetical protein D6705_01760 [Deltaproteobacteria bacterium]